MSSPTPIAAGATTTAFVVSSPLHFNFYPCNTLHTFNMTHQKTLTRQGNTAHFTYSVQSIQVVKVMVRSGLTSGSGDEQMKAKVCCVELEEVAVTFGPPPASSRSLGLFLPAFLAGSNGHNLG